MSDDFADRVMMGFALFGWLVFCALAGWAAFVVTSALLVAVA